jgi:selenide,water dikinase
VKVEHLKRNDGAEQGDVLVLTKPLGVGILATAQKRGVLQREHATIGRDLMCRSNRIGSLLGTQPSVHALTDVTGFGLGGHLLELCQGAGLNSTVHMGQVPVIPEARTYLQKGCYPDGSFRNWKSLNTRISGASDMERMMLLSDPQTSGGLLVSVAPADLKIVLDLIRQENAEAAVIGTMTDPAEVPTIAVI